MKKARILVVVLAVLGFLSGTARAETPVELFKSKCRSCHTIGGGRLVGPDLQDVGQRKERSWLARFIVDPQTVLASGDAYALKLKEEARGVVMANIPGMTIDQAMELLDLIEAESVLEKSQFAGIKISDRPFTEADIRTGRDLFLGHQALINGGTPCVSCHSVNGIGVLAGGALGPDLNAVFERLNGRRGLMTWLSAPATTTMGAVFGPHPLEAEEEILPLVAYFADLATNPAQSTQAATLIFVLLGLAGTSGVLMTFDAVWGGRFRSVRKDLVEKSAGRSEG